MSKWVNINEDKDAEYGTWVDVPDKKSSVDLAREATIRQLAALALVPGATVHSMAKSVGIDDKTVKKYMNTDEFRALVKYAGDTAFTVALAQLKMEAQKRLAKAMCVLDTQLDRNNLQAAVQVFKMIDKENQKEEEKKTDTTIQIMMPRELKKADVEATAKEVGSEEKS